MRCLKTAQMITIPGRQLDLIKIIAYTTYVSDPHSIRTRSRSGAALRVPNNMLHSTKFSSEHTNMWRESGPPGIMGLCTAKPCFNSFNAVFFQVGCYWKDAPFLAHWNVISSSSLSTILRYLRFNLPVNWCVHRSRMSKISLISVIILK